MKNIINEATRVANEEASKLNLEILDVEYVREHGNMILRIIAESENGLTIEESTDLNMAISERLDKIDLIEDEYFLEVSSAGLEQEIKKEADLLKAIDKYIFVKTYEKVNNIKEIYGDLISINEDTIELKVNVKGQFKNFIIERKNIAKIRHAVKF